jgi:hypothetical protein
MKDHKQFTFLVAKGMTDYEADGCYCSFCGEQVYGEDNVGEHEKDCAMLQARVLLGDEWVKYQKDLESKERQRVAEIKVEAEKKERKRLAKINRVNCDICNKHVSKDGLEAHKRMNKDCIEQSKRFRYVSVEVTDLWDDVNQ